MTAIPPENLSNYPRRSRERFRAYPGDLLFAIVGLVDTAVSFPEGLRLARGERGFDYLLIVGFVSGVSAAFAVLNIFLIRRRKRAMIILFVMTLLFTLGGVNSVRGTWDAFWLAAEVATLIYIPFRLIGAFGPPPQ